MAWSRKESRRARNGTQSRAEDGVAVEGGRVAGAESRAGFVARGLSLLLRFHYAVRTVSGPLSVRIGDILEDAAAPP